MILDRYIVKEVIPNFLIGLLVFTFVLLMNQILLLAETLITKGVEFIKIFLIIFYLLPALTVLTIPMSLLLGVLLGLGRLNGDSELTVMRASGISFHRLMLPIIGIGVLSWVLCSYLIQVSVPWGNYTLNRLMFKIYTTKATSELKPRVFYNEFTNMVLYVQDIPSTGNLWKGVFIYDESKPDTPRLVLAKEGVVKEKPDGPLELELRNGSWHEVDPRKPQDYTSVYFFQNIFPLRTRMQLSGADLPKGDRDQTISELKKTIQEHKEKKLPYRFLEVEIHKKYAIPFACIVFAFLATTLGFSSKKGGRSSAYAISIGIILIYYIFLIGGERFGDSGTIPPWLAAWAGNIVLGVMGLILFLHANSRAFIKSREALVSFLAQKASSLSAGQALGQKQVRIVIRIQKFPWRVIVWIEEIFLIARRWGGTVFNRQIFTLIDKYIVLEFTKFFVLILIALILIAELIEATQLVDDLFRNNVGVAVLLQYLKFHFPQWIFYVLPVSALTTTLVVFGILSKNSEIIALKSSGISLYRIAAPIIVMSVLLSGFAFWLQDYILPLTNKVANRYKRQLKGLPSETFSTFERYWISASDGFYNYDLFDVRNKVVYGFSIYLVDMENFSLLKRVYARQAFYKDPFWFLRQGWQRNFQRGKMKYEPFRTQRMKSPVNPEYFITPNEVPSEMNFAQLQRYITKIKEQGFDFVRYAVDLQAKLSFPTVSLILTLIAVPFSFTTGKRGALYGIGLSIVMGIVFWFFLALTKSLGYLEILNPFLAAWTPNILATLLALYLLFKLRT